MRGIATEQSSHRGTENEDEAPQRHGGFYLSVAATNKSGNETSTSTHN